MKTFAENCSEPVIEYLNSHLIEEGKYSESRLAAKLPIHGEVEDNVLPAEYGSGDKRHKLAFRWKAGEEWKKEVRDCLRNDEPDSMADYYCGEIANSLRQYEIVRRHYQIIVSERQFEIIEK